MPSIPPDQCRRNLRGRGSVGTSSPNIVELAFRLFGPAKLEALSLPGNPISLYLDPARRIFAARA